MKPIKAQDEVIDIIEMLENDVRSGWKLCHKFMSVPQFKEESRAVSNALQKYSSEQIGKALKQAGYTYKMKKINSKMIRGYELPYWERTGDNYFSH